MTRVKSKLNFEFTRTWFRILFKGVQGEESRLYFWRDHAGHEVDLVRDDGAALYPIELKAAATFHPDFVAALRYFNRLQGLTDAEAAGAVYCAIAGPDYDYRGYGAKSWRALAR
jgi:hypothetical protein